MATHREDTRSLRASSSVCSSLVLSYILGSVSHYFIDPFIRPQRNTRLETVQSFNFHLLSSGAGSGLLTRNQ